MYSIVKQVRHHGVALPERAIANDPGISGDLALFWVGQTRVMQLRTRGNNSADGVLLNPLNEPHCCGMGGGTMIFRGYQRSGNPDDPMMPSYVQEWRITVLDQP